MLLFLGRALLRDLEISVAAAAASGVARGKWKSRVSYLIALAHVNSVALNSRHS